MGPPDPAPQAAAATDPLSAAPRVRHRWFDKSISIGEKLAVIASLFAVIWLSREQSATDAALARRETTLALVSLSFSEPVFAAKRHVVTEFSQNAARYAPAALGVKREALPPELRTSFVVLIEFYSNVAICRKSGACDEKLVDDFFRDDACPLLSLYDENAREEIEREYGASISEKLSAYCAASASS